MYKKISAPHAFAGWGFVFAALLPPPAFAAAPPAAPAAASKAASKAEDSYYGVYLGKGKLGSATVTRDDHAVREGKAAVKFSMRMTMDLQAFGASGRIETDSVTWSNPKTGEPVESRSRTESAGRVTTVTAVYGPRSLSYVANIDGSATKGTLTLAPGEQFLIDPSDGAAMTPQIGVKRTGKLFNSTTLRLVDGAVEVLGKETVAVGGAVVEAYKIRETNPLAPSTVWASDNGDLLRVDMPMGLQMLRESKAAALAPAGTNGTTAAPDIASLASVVPGGEPITDTIRYADSLTYEISGVTHSLPPDDTVQTVSPVSTVSPSSAASGLRRVTVYALPLSPARTPAPRFTSSAGGAVPIRLRPFLATTPYVAASDPAFVRQAQEIVGGETSNARAAARIAAYVHNAVRYDPSIPALRTAADIRRDPRGVCRDYATLFATLARAAGIPTKICVGLGYGRAPDGTARFFGHAWDEVWVGTDDPGATGGSGYGDHWVAVDPTWGTPIADATHLKLAEGEITDFFDVASDMGNYHIKVLFSQ